MPVLIEAVALEQFPPETVLFGIPLEEAVRR